MSHRRAGDTGDNGTNWPVAGAATVQGGVVTLVLRVVVGDVQGAIEQGPGYHGTIKNKEYPTNNKLLSMFWPSPAL